MRELGIEIPDERSVAISRWRRLQARLAPVDRLLARQEAMEQAIAAEIDERPTGDADTDRLLEEIRDEEKQHTDALAHAARRRRSRRCEPAARDDGPQVRLTRILGRERWHRGIDGWISGAIYGANDGLAAVFGLVAGFSGATGGSHLVLTAGLFGAIGSALSMATGAYLAERSTAEVAAANLAREREEVLAHPEEEKEELSLYYQLKGLTEDEADMVVERIAEDPEKLFAAIADRGVRQRRRRARRPDRRRRSPAASRPRSARWCRCCRSSSSRGTAGVIVAAVGLARRALRGRRREVAVHAAQRLVGRARDDARRRCSSGASTYLLGSRHRHLSVR